jgi:hypothetical protein
MDFTPRQETDFDQSKRGRSNIDHPRLTVIVQKILGTFLTDRFAIIQRIIDVMQDFNI